MIENKYFISIKGMDDFIQDKKIKKEDIKGINITNKINEVTFDKKIKCNSCKNSIDLSEIKLKVNQEDRFVLTYFIESEIEYIPKPEDFEVKITTKKKEIPMVEINPNEEIDWETEKKKKHIILEKQKNEVKSYNPCCIASLFKVKSKYKDDEIKKVICGVCENVINKENL